MGRGVHFSLDSLPERYRVQAAEKLAASSSAEDVGKERSCAVEGSSCASGAKGGCIARKKKAATSARRGMNRTEERFLREVLGGNAMYEAMTFVPVPKCRYTPDFCTWDERGMLTCYEVKGSHPFPSENRARFAFLSCRDRFPHVSFRWFRSDRMGRFHEEHVER